MPGGGNGRGKGRVGGEENGRKTSIEIITMLALVLDLPKPNFSSGRRKWDGIHQAVIVEEGS